MSMAMRALMWLSSGRGLVMGVRSQLLGFAIVKIRVKTMMAVLMVVG